jgi:hypothetical protein
MHTISLYTARLWSIKNNGRPGAPVASVNRPVSPLHTHPECLFLTTCVLWRGPSAHPAGPCRHRLSPVVCRQDDLSGTEGRTTQGVRFGKKESHTLPSLPSSSSLYQATLVGTKPSVPKVAVLDAQPCPGRPPEPNTGIPFTPTSTNIPCGRTTPTTLSRDTSGLPQVLSSLFWQLSRARALNVRGAHRYLPSLRESVLDLCGILSRLSSPLTGLPQRKTSKCRGDDRRPLPQSGLPKQSERRLPGYMTTCPGDSSALPVQGLRQNYSFCPSGVTSTIWSIPSYSGTSKSYFFAMAGATNLPRRMRLAAG